MHALHTSVWWISAHVEHADFFPQISLGAEHSSKNMEVSLLGGFYFDHISIFFVSETDYIEANSLYKHVDSVCAVSNLSPL